MKYAYNDHGVLRDVVQTAPNMLFPPHYAEQFVEVPDESQNGWLWDGETATAPPVPEVQITSYDVDAERDRRTDAGFTYLGHLFQSDQKSRENITGATTSAVAYLVGGGSATEADWTGSGSPFVWLAEDNAAVPLTAPEMIAFGNAAMAHVAAHIHKGRAIKALDPIPVDFANDSYWI